MISVHGLTYRYPPPDSREALRNIGFQIPEQGYTLLCGGSGSGKSTLAYALCGLIPHALGGTLEGRVAIAGKDTRTTPLEDLLPEVGMVFQNADAQLFNGTVEEELGFAMEGAGLGDADIRKRVRRLAEPLGLEPLLDRAPATLSGGEKRLAALASVLALDPSALVLDEPFAHLDWEGAARVHGLFAGLLAQGKTLVVVEQRLGPVFAEATQCLVLEDGALLYDGPTQEARPLLCRLGFFQEDQDPFPPKAPGEVLLSVRDLHGSLGGMEILQGVDLDLREGEIVALIGPNGAGKTTLCRHLNALLRPERGAVLFLGAPMGGRSPAEIATLVGLSFQNPNDQFFKTTVREEILAGPEITRSGFPEAIASLSRDFVVERLLPLSPYRLSEGEKRRVALASLVIMGPKVLVLDEPTVGQDGRFLQALAGILSRLRDQGMGILLVTHDLSFARRVAQRWVFLDRGRIRAEGTHEAWDRVRTLMGPSPLDLPWARGLGREGLP